MAEEEEYTVEKILDKRMRGGKTEYLIKWEGYPDRYLYVRLYSSFSRTVALVFFLAYGLPVKIKY